MSIQSTNQADHAVLQSDCIHLLDRIPRGTIDLVYMDPPFSTGRTQSGRSGNAFEDRWPSTAAWVEFMRPRLEAVLETLSPQGSILFHCDWRTSHHARLMLDEFLGENRFQNQLVWQYGLGGSSPRRFARKHDDILYYSASADWYFDPPMVPATSNRMKGMLKKATDVLDVPAINNMARERTGWPMQKPLALLELLIHACCPPGGRVLDPMCGSGTTLVAAANTGRRAIGFDRLSDAVSIARARLEEISDERLGATLAPQSAVRSATS